MASIVNNIPALRAARILDQTLANQAQPIQALSTGLADPAETQQLQDSVEISDGAPQSNSFAQENAPAGSSAIEENPLRSTEGGINLVV